MVDDITATQPRPTDTEHGLLAKALKVRLSRKDCSSDSEACVLIGTAPEVLSSIVQPPSNAERSRSSIEQHAVACTVHSGAKAAQDITWPSLMASTSASEEQGVCEESQAAAAQQLSDEAGSAIPAHPAAAATGRLFGLQHCFCSAERYCSLPSSGHLIYTILGGIRSTASQRYTDSPAWETLHLLEQGAHS